MSERAALVIAYIETFFQEYNCRVSFLQRSRCGSDTDFTYLLQIKQNYVQMFFLDLFSVF